MRSRTEAPADAMLDFYNELQAAVKGRPRRRQHDKLRVNDALRDIFIGFTLISPPHDLGEGITGRTEPAARSNRDAVT